YDAWWKARNTRNFVNHIPEGTATLVVGGLFDAEDCFGAWRLYGAIEKSAKNNNKLVMGPWSHGQWASNDGTKLGNVKFGSNTSQWFQNQIEIPFFNYYLKDKGSVQTLPEATIFFSGENKWRTFDHWPPTNSSSTPIYLQANGKLNWSKSVAKESFSEYISDPSRPVPFTEHANLPRTNAYMTEDQRFASRRADVLVFQTDVLTEDVTLAGTVVADLLTKISTTDADFVVKLIDVFPELPNAKQEQTAMDSYQMLVRGEIMRGRYRKSFESPVAFVPNQIDHVKFELPDVAHTFQKGHRLMIQIQSSWFPLADRNPQKFVNIYSANENDFQKANVKIYHDSNNSSQILLPILK
ncbi:MAG TPA: X-Pro dipeptidyl-peptidase, partial [Cytophagales bacterium]|nr:X-Pro dipeptidyl-peptidase [Cytophagales bacterium]